MKNIILKLFSLGVAIILWYVVNSEGNLTVVTFSSQIEVRDVPAGRVVLEQSHKHAEVNIKGPSFLVSKIAAAPPAFRLRVPADSGNKPVVPLSKSMLELPPYVTIISVDPPEVELTFDNLGEKRVPVVVPRIGSLEESLVVKDLTIVPSQVVVTGPQSELETLTSIETYPLDLRDAKASIERTINLRSSSSRLELSETQVLLRVTIEPIQQQRRFVSLPIEIRAASDSGSKIAVDPVRVAVEVTGPRAQMKELSQKEIIPFVRVGNDDEQGARLPISVELPRGVTLLSLDPDTVTLSLGSLPAPRREVKPGEKK